MVKLVRFIFSVSKIGRFFLFIFLCAGCANRTIPVALLSGVSKEGAPICLGDRSGIPAFVQQFYNQRDLTTEEGKIDYLLERLRNSQLVFIRNRVEYTGPQAAGFLRWKLDRWRNRHHIKINTAQEFVDHIASGSKTSGDPYVVILEDGGRHNLRNVLQNELDALEVCLRDFPPSAPESTLGEGSTIRKSAAEASQTMADNSTGVLSGTVFQIGQPLNSQSENNFEFLPTKM